MSEQSGIKAGDEGFQVTVKGNTDLKGAVIASTEAATQGQKNSLTTGSLTTSDLENHATYSGSSVSLSGGYSRNSDLGKDTKGTASATPVPGTTLPSLGGWSAAPPIAMSASGNGASTTKSGISGGAIAITNEAQQQTLTGKDGATTVASLNREVSSDKDGSNKLKPIFNKEEIQADFQIVGAFANQVGTFLANRAREVDALQKAIAAETDEDKVKVLQAQLDAASKWGPGGSYRQILTALTTAVSGNVTGSGSQLLQNTVVAYLQSLGVENIKAIADSLKNRGTATAESEATRTALQALVGCAGAAASQQSCGAGAMGAAASVVLNNLLDSLSGTDSDKLSASEKEARKNLVTSLVAGIAAAGGGTNIATATGAATIEVENNHLGPTQAMKFAAVLQHCASIKSADCAKKIQYYKDLSYKQGGLTTLAEQREWEQFVAEKFAPILEL